MAAISTIKLPNNTSYNMRDDYHTWGGRNLLSQFVVPGQNGPGRTASGGRTAYVGPYAIDIPATENADTYFSLWTIYELEDNVTYTLSCQVSNLLNGTFYNFPLYAQSNPINTVLSINKNGLNYVTFTKTAVEDIVITYGGAIYHKLFMDDSARTITTGQGTIHLSKFKLERGNKPTDWSPAPEDTGYVSGTELNLLG